VARNKIKADMGMATSIAITTLLQLQVRGSLERAQQQKIMGEHQLVNGQSDNK